MSKIAKKKTHSEYVDEVKLINSNIDVIGIYSGANTKIKHRCLIDKYEWDSTPHNILNGRGCPLCGGTIKKTHEEYVYEVSLVNPNIEVIEKYINFQTPILHKCIIHMEERKVAPRDVLYGHGCRLCGNKKISNAKKSNNEEYTEKLKMINQNICVVDKYIDSKTPILHKCLLDGHEWYARPNNILKGRGCPLCGKEITRAKNYDYAYMLSIKNPDIEVIEKYINAKTKILHHCLIHDFYWKACPGNILNGNGCPECRKEKIIKNKRLPHNKYVEELKIKNPNVIVLEKYINMNTPILHKCILHDVEWTTIPSVILQGCGCFKCKSEKIINNLSKSHEQYVKELKTINQNIIPLEKYQGACTPILHRCLKDNNKWYTIPSRILSGGGCPRCNESKGERQVRLWLEEHNISYEKQYKFEDCCDNKPLPFDFYLPTYNKAIEYDGKQHFEPIEFFGGQKAFEYLIKHDAIKNEYCKNNNIPLLRIPYYKNVEEELNNFLFI